MLAPDSDASYECRSCGAHFRPTVRSCSLCGDATLDPDRETCTVCGADLRAGRTQRCPACGSEDVSAVTT